MELSSTFPTEFNRGQQAILDRIARCQDMLDRVLLQAKRVLESDSARELKSEEFFAEQVPWTHRGQIVSRVVPFIELDAAPLSKRASAATPFSLKRTNENSDDPPAAEFFSQSVSWQARSVERSSDSDQARNFLTMATQSALQTARKLADSSKS